MANRKSPTKREYINRILSYAREEDKPFNEHRQQRKLPAVAHSDNDDKGEKRVEPHARSEDKRVV